MTRDELLQLIENKYEPILRQASTALLDAQLTYSDALTYKQTLINSVNEYYDALDTQVRIQPIIIKGPPTVTP